MNGHVAGRAWWPVPTILWLACAATTRSAYGDAGDDDHDGGLNAPVLERDALVRAVLRRNPSLESARQAWRATLARSRQAGALEDPTVAAAIAPLSIASSSARVGWEATVSQRLPWPGKLRLDGAVAEAEADAAENDFEASRRDLALAASLLFDDYFVDERSLAINARHVELMRDLQAAATAQYEAGRASAQDPLQAEFELAHMEHDAVLLASQRDVAIAQMNELLHRAPDSPLPPAPETLPEPSVPELRDASRLESEALGRPEIVAARAHARAEQARADRAAREYLPDIAVSTSFNSMWDTPEHRWMVGLEFNLPLPTRRRAGAVDEANAMRAGYEADEARIRDAARTAVAIAVKRVEESEHVLRLFDHRLLPIARLEVDAARAAFTASRAPFVGAIDAEKNLRSVELDQQKALADCDRRRAELDHALGRVPGVAHPQGTP